MAGSGVWRAIGYGAFITGAVVSAAAMTVVVVPRSLALVTDPVGVDGTVVGVPVGVVRPAVSRPTSALPDATGVQWVKRMRLPGANPEDATTGSSLSAWTGLLCSVVLGPLLQIGAGRAALIAAVRWIRSTGEAG